MARIVFVNGVAAPTLAAGQVLDSPVASVRLRCLVPAAGLRALGHETGLVSLADIARPGIAERLRDPAIRIVLGKPTPGTFARHSGICTAALDALERLAAVRPIHADVCDLMAADEGPAGRHRELVVSRFVPIVPSRWLSDHYRPICHHPPLVVEDPAETEETARPRFDPGPELRFVWFGTWGPGTARLLARTLDGIRLADRRLALTVVTQTEAAGEVARLADAMVDRVEGSWRITHRDWSLPAVAAAMADADFVLLPQPAGDPRADAKSHNRLVEAIRQGRFALAAPIPAYRELDCCAWVGEASEGVRWALANPVGALARIAAGQAEVARRFAPAAVARRWATALALPSP